jgi:hypothetical protein
MTASNSFRISTTRFDRFSTMSAPLIASTVTLRP